MAKNISLLGANYPDVPAVTLPQTGGGVATFVDADNSSTGANAITTSHTIKYARAARVGNLYIATITVDLTSNVSAWATFMTLNNVSIDASTYVFADVGNTTKELYVGNTGGISCTTSLSSGSEIKVTIPLAVI